MKRRVYKYEIPLREGSKFDVKCFSQMEILRIGVQNGVPQMWALVGIDSAAVTRTFKMYGTGQDVGAGELYRGTYEMGPFVLHLFEVVKCEA